MNLYTGILSLAVGLALIWATRPDKSGVHPKYLRFDAALVLYPPLVLVFLAFGFTGIVSGLLGK
jgi:hypothetical protein